MKKKLVRALVLSIFFMISVAVGTVNAADTWYTCTVTMVGSGEDGATAIYNLSCPAKAAGSLWYFSSAASTKFYLATALTAVAGGNSVYVKLDSALGEWQAIKALMIIP